jgi:fused signal recognition particle receptor
MESGSFFQRLKQGLSRSRQGWAQKLGGMFQRPRWDEEDFSLMEEVLIGADLGPKATDKLLQAARQHARRNGVEDGVADVLQQELIRIMASPERGAKSKMRYAERPWVVLFVGVNGVGKTTTIGKLAAQQAQAGKKVMLVAADTFRAAAIDQLELWAEKAGVEMIKHQAGQDPSGVVFDAMKAAKKRGMDVVLIDTAGRLHTKVHLVAELKKMRQVISRELPDAPHETLLVLDAGTGQNAIQQAKVFKESMGVTGIVLTKLDGTAKGGIVVGIQEELGLPVEYIGVGEEIEDLHPFDPGLFVQALFA